MITFSPATIQDIPTIIDIAEKTWWPTYGPILEKEQISFMLSLIYSHETLAKVMTDGTQEFILLKDNGVQGFAAFGLRPEDPAVAKLHKLYVLPENHGKGYGKMLLDEVKKRCAERGIFVLDLNVNRYNTALAFYEKHGFVRYKEEDVPIGPYWMNDFVLRFRQVKETPENRNS